MGPSRRLGSDAAAAVALEEKGGLRIEPGEGGAMPARGLAGPRLGSQNFAPIAGAEKKQGLFIEGRHRDYLDRKAFRRGPVLNRDVLRPQPENAGPSREVCEPWRKRHRGAPDPDLRSP